MLLTVIVNDAVSPTRICASAADFTTLTSGQLTAIDAPSLASPSFVEVMFPVLLTVPQLAGVVPLVTWTVPLTAVLPLIEPTLQVRTWLPTAPLIAHVEPLPVDASIDQFRPAAPGRLSVTTTPVALPAPELPQLRVNPTGSPALTEAPSAVLSIVTWAGMTWKHSVVLLVWLAARYLEPSAGV